MKLRFYTQATASLPGCDYNCWNSIAVMFELRCSEFELFCSVICRSNHLVRDQTSCALWCSTEHESWIQREACQPVDPACGLPRIANQQSEHMPRRSAKAKDA